MKGLDLKSSLDGLRNYQSGSKLKQAVQAFFTQNLLNQQELNDMAELFRKFDKNANGVLSRDELIDAYRSIRGINFSEKEIDDMIKRVDADGSGDINYSEFINTALTNDKLLTDDRLEKAFKVFDKDGNNEITVAEIKDLLDACRQVDEKMVQRAIKDIDKIGKGKLTFAEFKKLIKTLFNGGQ